jgi:hypothetical protein
MRRVGLWLAALAAGSAVPASAQLGVGRSGTSTESRFGSEVAMEALTRFGRCYAATVPKSAFALVGTVPGTADEAKVYRRLFSGESTPCLGSITELRVPPQFVRGAIAEGLYREHVPLPPALRLVATGPAEVRDLSGAARCYVSQQPTEAHALLRTNPASQAEYEAVKGLMPAFASCLPGGVQANFPATMIRYRIAEALYRTGAERPATRAE